MLNVLRKYKDADPFRLPVDWVAMGIPDYPDVIKHPMDFKTVREKVRAGAYASMDEWHSDMQLIWDNCRKYNGDNHDITRSAEKMKTFMERRMEEAIAGAARELSAAQQRAGAGGLAGRGTAGGSKTTNREVALLRASLTPSGSDSDGEEDGRQAWPAPRAVSSSKQLLVLQVGGRLQRGIAGGMPTAVHMWGQ
ncbi:Bromodomain-containing protein [Scenedesmus sp. NREL 46B-D3]|nr:Bromodomain-containing protein [Scenedesmus sp. NREL 46B-D3]